MSGERELARQPKTDGFDGAWGGIASQERSAFQKSPPFPVIQLRLRSSVDPLFRSFPRNYFGTIKENGHTYACSNTSTPTSIASTML
jgi:hypothetical protein